MKMPNSPMAPIEQAFHANAYRYAVNDAAIDTYARAGHAPPTPLLARRKALEAERQRLIAHA